MAESVNSHLDGRQLDAGPIRLPEWATPVLLGLAGGVVAALFVTAHWTIAIAAALVVLALSAAENEPFFLIVIFLLPLSWTRAEGAIRDVTTPLRVAVIAGFFAGRVLRGNLDWRRLFAPSISRASILLLAVMTATVAVGPVGWQHDSIAQIYRLVSWIGFYFFVLVWIDSRQRLRRVLEVFLASLCMLGLFSVIQEAVGGYTRLWLYLNPPGPDFNPWSGRAPSLLAYYTSLSGCVELMVPIALATWLMASGRLKKLGACAFGLGVCSLLLSQSLGGLLALGFVLVLGIYHFVKSWWHKALLSGGLVVVAGGLYVARRALNPAHFAASAGSLEPSVVGRLLQFHAAWVIFLRHPLLGVGFGNFGAVSSALMPQVSWITSVSQIASNLYLNLLAEAGVVGLGVFLYLIYLAARKARNQIRAKSWELAPVFAFGSLGAVMTVLVHGLVDYLFFYCPQYGTLLWVVFALLVVSCRLNYIRKPSVSRPGAGSLGGRTG